MAKRFTDTQKYKKPFLRSLPGPYKIFWDYLYHECDHAGIWIVDFEIAQIYVGMDMPIDKENALKYFNKDEERVVVLNGGSKWFIPTFIEFQYGELNPNNRVHNSVIQILNRYKLFNNKGLISPIERVKDKDKDKDKDKTEFEKFWNYYDKKRKKKKCQTKWMQISSADKNLIREHLPKYIKSTPEKQYRKDPYTYLNNESWNDEIISFANAEDIKSTQSLVNKIGVQ